MNQNVFVAFHDRNTEKTSVYNNHAVLTDQQFEPFLVTRFDLFLLPLSELTAHIRTTKARTRFKKAKKSVAAFLLALALPSALIYFLLTLNIIALSLPSWVLIALKQEIFLATLSLLILWHDLATNYDAPKSLPRYPILDDVFKESLETNGVQFQQYLIHSPIYYLHPVTAEILFSSLSATGSNSYIDSMKLLHLLLKQEGIKQILKALEIDDIEKLFAELNISNDSLPKYPYTALQSLLLYTTEQAILSDSEQILPEHLLLALFSIYPALQQILSRHSLQLETFVQTIAWFTLHEQRGTGITAFSLTTPYFKRGGFVDSWVKGESKLLDAVTTNVIADLIRADNLIGIGHENEVNTVVGILQKEFTSNIFFVGEKGVGKSNIIYCLAQRMIDNDIPQFLRNITIRKLSLTSLIARGTTHPQGLTDLVEKIVQELRRETQTILYFDDIEQALTSGVTEATIMSYLLPVLLQSGVPVIGTTTYAQFQRLQETSPELLSYFKEVFVTEPSIEETFLVLMTKKKLLERKYKISISIPALQDIVLTTATYQPTEKFPLKAVLLLENLAIAAANMPNKRLARDHVVIPQHVEDSSIPIPQPPTVVTEHLLSLEKRIHQKYVNQQDAVLQVVTHLQSKYAQNQGQKHPPLGTFLFLGPSGVGKTELARILAAEYFQDIFSVIRISFSQVKTVSQLATQLSKIERHSAALLMLDDIEHISTELSPILSTILTKGYVTLDSATMIDLSQAIIVATSTVGEKEIAQATKETFSTVRAELIEKLPQLIPVENIAHFEQIVVFESLSLENLYHIVVLALTQLAEKLTARHITLGYHDTDIATIVAKSFVPGKGARPVMSFLSKSIEPQIAKAIIEQQMPEQESLHISISDILQTL